MDSSAQQESFREDHGVSTKGLRLASNTKNNYKGYIRMLLVWLVANNPEFTTFEEDDELPDLKHIEEPGECIALPLSVQVVEKYMSHVQLKRDKSTGLYIDPPAYYSYSHVNSHRSAIKSLHRDRGMICSDEMALEFADTMAGYKRRIAQLKQDGLMNAFEGRA
jgi:hypothetical protein